MGVSAVTRKNPQPLAALRVSLANSADIATLNAALLTAPAPANKWKTESLTDPSFTGGWRLRFSLPGLPDQFAYQGDWILVTDATYHDDTKQWTLAATTKIVIYGVAPGCAGTATDFADIFTGM